MQIVEYSCVVVVKQFLQKKQFFFSSEDQVLH